MKSIQLARRNKKNNKKNTNHEWKIQTNKKCYRVWICVSNSTTSRCCCFSCLQYMVVLLLFYFLYSHSLSLSIISIFIVVYCFCFLSIKVLFFFLVLTKIYSIKFSFYNNFLLVSIRICCFFLISLLFS